MSRIKHSLPRKKLDMENWISYELRVKTLIDPISFCDPLLKWNEIESFLKRMHAARQKISTKKGN